MSSQRCLGSQMETGQTQMHSRPSNSRLRLPCSQPQATCTASRMPYSVLVLPSRPL